MKKLLTINVGTDGRFAMCFAYFQNGDKILYKGSKKLILDQLKASGLNYVCNFVLWSQTMTIRGRVTERFSFWRSNIFYIRHSVHEVSGEIRHHDKKFTISPFKGDAVLKLKRIPHKWIPEYDKLIAGNT